MSNIRQRVLLDIFAAPTTFFPVVGGITLFLLAWMFDWGGSFMFLGFAGILFGIGLLVSKIVFQIESLTEKAYNIIIEEEKQSRERELDRIEETLSRNQNAVSVLRRLRDAYRIYQEQHESASLLSLTGVSEKVENLFQVSVKELETLHSLYYDKKGIIYSNYQQGLAEVRKSAECLEKLVEESHILSTQAESQNISQVREELQQSVETMQNSVKRLSERF
jgi:valyl-tRNA synthetase